MLRTKVKASSITNLTDARYFAAFEVEWMGFCLDPSDGSYLQPQMVQAIKEWVDGPKFCGEFGLQSAGEIATAVDLMELDAIQVAPVADQELLAELHGKAPLIRELVIERDAAPSAIGEQMEAESALVAAFLLDFEKNGITWADLETETKLSLSWLREIAQSFPILISIDLNPSQLNRLLAQVQPLGLSLRGGAEEKVGFKSFDELDELFEQLQLLE